MIVVFVIVLIILISYKCVIGLVGFGVGVVFLVFVGIVIN